MLQDLPGCKNICWDFALVHENHAAFGKSRERQAWTGRKMPRWHPTHASSNKDVRSNRATHELPTMQTCQTYQLSFRNMSSRRSAAVVTSSCVLPTLASLRSDLSAFVRRYVFTAVSLQHHIIPHTLRLEAPVVTLGTLNMSALTPKSMLRASDLSAFQSKKSVRISGPFTSSLHALRPS